MLTTFIQSFISNTDYRVGSERDSLCKTLFGPANFRFLISEFKSKRKGYNVKGVKGIKKV